MPTGRLTPDDLERCYDYTYRAWQNESERDFGGARRREWPEFLADHLEGKLTEIALEHLLAQQGLRVELDFATYPGRGNLDAGDLKRVQLEGGWVTPPDGLLDAKGSTARAQWLLVERHKFTCRLYVFFRLLGLPTNPELRANPWRCRGQGYEWEAVGWATREVFFCPADREPWFAFRAGQRLYRAADLPGAPPVGRDELRLASAERVGGELRAPMNYGLPVKWLGQNWEALVQRILSACSGQ